MGAFGLNLGFVQYNQCLWSCFGEYDENNAVDLFNAILMGTRLYFTMVKTNMGAVSVLVRFSKWLQIWSDLLP